MNFRRNDEGTRFLACSATTTRYDSYVCISVVWWTRVGKGRGGGLIK